MRVLATTDGSEYSTEALRRLVGLIPKEGTEVHLISVFPSPMAGALGMMGPPYVDYVQLTEQMRGEAETFVKDGAALLQAEGLQVRTDVFEGDPATLILDLAQRDASDLIVVGSHGRTGVARFLLGSVSSRVVSHAPCSVLVIRHAQPATR